MLPIIKNILLSLLVVFAWSLSDVLAKYFVSIQNMNSHLFTFYKFLGAAFVLMLLSGKPKVSDLKALKNPYTWLYVILMIIVNIMYAVSLKTITATEAALLIQSQIILHAVVAYIFMKRKQSLASMPGYFVVFVAAAYVAFTMPETKQHAIGLLVMGLTVLFCVARTVTAEIHPEVSKKLSFSERCKTTGYISFATSLFLLSIMIIGAFLSQTMMASVSLMQHAPALSEVLDYKLIAAGLFTGIFVVSVGMYVFFYVNSRFGAENFAIVMAFQPAINFMLESLGATHFGMSVQDISHSDLLAGLAIILAALYMLWVKSASERTSHREFKKQRMEDHFDMISRSYDFCDQDARAVSEKLDIDIEQVEAILQSKGHLALDYSEDKIASIERHYRRKIAEADYLTGLATRSSLIKAMNGAWSRNEDFSLFYLDLDKFKPVNDTYGHEAGDEVLKNISSRLKNIAPETALVCRLGGDEFAMMIREIDDSKIADLVKTVKDVISLPITLKNSQKVSVGTSIGLATTNSCNTDSAEELLKEADLNMYESKKGRI